MSTSTNPSASMSMSPITSTNPSPNTSTNPSMSPSASMSPGASMGPGMGPSASSRTSVGFAALHRPGEPLLLPNAWDYASARLLTEMGYHAIGTTSYGVALANGLPDGTGATRDETAALARRLSSLPVHLTVDIESGFSDEPDVVAAFVQTLKMVNVDGINIEDALGDPSVLVNKIAAIKAAAPGVFVNARTDTYWLGDHGKQRETLRRVEAYVEAGADGIFVPALQDPALIKQLVALGKPLNILLQSNGLTVPQLADLGVARISAGSLLFRIALGTLRAWRWEVVPAGEELLHPDFRPDQRPA
ncbi:isocitrate lyase/PEP mutase family protein [Allorhizocola rhizosphaerae]|uniref:isocitrate lyase/PEP mutase family protein n=1 Tax=Allorhizocola rhizosphaerae TaxID=1872709 RepID=UPI001FE2D976|nr:isocitrate lyase/phosphoenolpyruvate mutase family protein [Allorhizocola rhizosphaerae]